MIAPHSLPAAGEGWAGAEPRTARRLYPLAVLPVEMPVLRLQQPCPRADRRGALDPRPARRSRPAGRAGARSRGRVDLLRRRHAVADAAGDGRGADRRGSRALWPVAPDLEITLEANPNSAEAERFAGFAAAGVNRLSLGIQALDPDGAAVSRPRGTTATRRSRRSASPATPFRRYSFDLIYARPGQSLAAWEAELERGAGARRRASVAVPADDRAGHRLRQPRRARRDARVPDEDTAAALFEATQDRLAAAGLPAYEISNHARPGAECRHNLAYWRYEDYLGIGPGAHGRVTTRAGGKIATRSIAAPPRPGSPRSRAPGRRSRRRRRSRARPRSRRWS